VLDFEAWGAHGCVGKGKELDFYFVEKCSVSLVAGWEIGISRELFSTIFASLYAPTGAGETGLAFPSLDSHHGRDRYPVQGRQTPARRGRKLVWMLVRLPSSFMDCLSSLMEKLLYHRTDAILTSISRVNEVKLTQSRITVSR